MVIQVRQKARGDFVATIFELGDGRVIVTDSTGPSAFLFLSERDWEVAESPIDAMEEYDSVTDAFLDVLPAPQPIG